LLLPAKPRVYAERLIDHFNLRVYFKRLFGPELDGKRSDKPIFLDHAPADGAP
jgi:phosphoglycolate phosphatase